VGEGVNARRVGQMQREIVRPRVRCSNGRYARTRPEPGAVAEDVRAPQASGIAGFVRRDLARRLPAICERLGGQVVDAGDMAALKVLLQLAGLDVPVKKVPQEKVPKFKEWAFARKALEEAGEV
jgi:hypothetical protein